MVRVAANNQTTITCITIDDFNSSISPNWENPETTIRTNQNTNRGVLIVIVAWNYRIFDFRTLINDNNVRVDNNTIITIVCNVLIMNDSLLSHSV